MMRSILVPLDGSIFGEHAVPLAAGIARKANAMLHLVHVHQVVPPATIAGVAVMDAIDSHMRQDEEAYLADVLRRLEEGPPVKVKTALLDGEVSESLRLYSSQNNVDLVVLSTHGRGAMGRFWLGSIADHLIREMPTPVLLVRPPEEKADLTRETAIKTVLLPLDGTPLAEQALEPTLEMAKLCGANLLLYRVVQPVLRPSYIPEGSTLVSLTHSVLEQINQLQQQKQSEAQAYLNQVAEELRKRGFSVQTCVGVDEEPSVGILLESQAKHVDLIAMETHARRGVSRLLRGSVAEKIVRGGTIPVFMHHPVPSHG